jgi:hypothetical protein
LFLIISVRMSDEILSGIAMAKAAVKKKLYPPEN